MPEDGMEILAYPTRASLAATTGGWIGRLSIDSEGESTFESSLSPGPSLEGVETEVLGNLGECALTDSGSGSGDEEEDSGRVTRRRRIPRKVTRK